MQFESAEIPTQIPVLSPDYDHAPIFSTAGAVVWIIDSQDEYLTSINELLRTAVFRIRQRVNSMPIIVIGHFIGFPIGTSDFGIISCLSCLCLLSLKSRMRSRLRLGSATRLRSFQTHFQ